MLTAPSHPIRSTKDMLNRIIFRAKSVYLFTLTYKCNEKNTSLTNGIKYPYRQKVPV